MRSAPGPLFAPGRMRHGIPGAPTTTLQASPPPGSSAAIRALTERWADADAASTTNRIYVANFSTQNVSVIDGSTNTILATVPVSISPSFVAVNPTTNRIYATSGRNEPPLVIIDGGTNSVVSTTPLFSSPRGVAVSPSTGRVYVADCGDNTVKVIQD